MTTRTEEPVIEKIRKLLDLAASSKLGDAENASLLAQKLLIQHNLTLADIKEKDPQDPNIVTHQTVIEAKGKGDKWKGLLLHTVTQNFLCGSVTTTTGYVLIGPEGNTAVARELYKWLVLSLTDIGKGEYQAHKDNKGLYSRKTWLNSFYLGAIASIKSKLDRQKEDLVQGNPIVLTSEGLVKAYKEEHFNLSIGRPHTNFSQGAYKKGLEIGEKLPTNPRRILD